MKILLSNDDGYFAAGLTALAAAIEPHADIVVVAPDRNQSGSSHSLTLDSPLRVGEIDSTTFFVNLNYTNGTILYRKSVLQTLPHRSRGFRPAFARRR